jgi:hypothetical protein
MNNRREKEFEFIFMKRMFMEKSLKRSYGLLYVVLAITAGFAGCSTKAENGVDGNLSSYPVLTAGNSPVIVDYNVDRTNGTTAVVYFTGAAGLPLTSADFAVTGGGAVGDVTVDGDRVTIIVTFKPNNFLWAKIYEVVIASTSEVVSGDASVKIIHKGTEGSEDSRIMLTAGASVSANLEDTTANVTFTAGEELAFDLVPADFAVTGGGTVSKVGVAEDRLTVTVNFPANNAYSPKTYTVSVAEDRERVRGSAGVTITHSGTSGSVDNRILLTAGNSPIYVNADDEHTDDGNTSGSTTVVYFTGENIPSSVTMDDFAVTGGGAVGVLVLYNHNRILIYVTFEKNDSSLKNIYNVVIPSTSERFRGDASVKIIHNGK